MKPKLNSKRKKYGGRTKGTPNRKTTLLREFTGKKFKSIQNLSPVEQIEVLESLLTSLIPIMMDLLEVKKLNLKLTGIINEKQRELNNG